MPMIPLMLYRPLFVVVLFTFLGLSGCLGPEPSEGDEAEGSGTPDPNVGPGPGEKGNKTISNNTQGEHSHYYWAGATEVSVFHDEVDVTLFPLDGPYEGCNAAGRARFDFEDDGDDVQWGSEGAINPSPVGGGPPRADVVFPGTKSITVTIDWDDANPSGPQLITGVAFQYKPPTERAFKSDVLESLPKANCGVIAPKGQAFTIPVRPFQFDPAHQVALSRWNFEIWGYTEHGIEAGEYGAPSASKGRVRVDMSINFGGMDLLDPQHPDLYSGNEQVDLGLTRGVANLTLVADPGNPVGNPLDGIGEGALISSPFGYKGENAEDLDGISLPRGSIVPMHTLQLEIVACIRYASTSGIPANPTTAYRLAYHGAESSVFRLVAPVEKREDCDVYVIRVVDEENDVSKDDSPYETYSQWEFRIVPFTSDQKAIGHFEGSYEFRFVGYSVEMFGEDKISQEEPL